MTHITTLKRTRTRGDLEDFAHELHPPCPLHVQLQDFLRRSVLPGYAPVQGYLEGLDHVREHDRLLQALEVADDHQHNFQRVPVFQEQP